MPLRAAPDPDRPPRPAGRRRRAPARTAALDGLLDDLAPDDAAALADAIKDIGADTGIVAAGSDADWLALACPEILTLADGILVGA